MQLRYVCSFTLVAPWSMLSMRARPKYSFWNEFQAITVRSQYIYSCLHWVCGIDTALLGRLCVHLAN